MKAWVVAVTTACQHGTGMLAIFTMANDVAEAVAQAVRQVISSHTADHPVSITSTGAWTVADDVVRAAAEQLAPEPDRG